MLLALDAGNTNITIGIFKKGGWPITAGCAPFANRLRTNGAFC